MHAQDTARDSRPSFRPRHTAWWIARGAPEQAAVRRGKFLYVWCEWCQREHQHTGCFGDCTPDPGECWCLRGLADGHRIAPCTRPGSPLKALGYVIREVIE